MWSSAANHLLTASAAISHAATAPPPELNRLMLLGFLSAFGTIVCLAQVRQYRGAKLPLAGFLTALAAYGFLAGAWPLGIVAIVAAGMAIRLRLQERCRLGHKATTVLPRGRGRSRTMDNSRRSRLFGSSFNSADNN